jgi:carbonic anhydrase
VQDVKAAHHGELLGLADVDARSNRLAELNVVEQVRNLARTTIVQDAWRRDQPLELHGWIYGLQDGLLHDLGVSLKA